MKIAAFNHGGSGIELASSRLRSLYVFQSSVWKDHEVEFNPKFSSINRFQCLHLQKVFNPRYILLAIYARIMGKLVIYDIVDQAYQIKHLIALFMMVFFSNVVVTDTNLRKNYLYKGTRKKNIFVIFVSALGFCFLAINFDLSFMQKILMSLSFPAISIFCGVFRIRDFNSLFVD